MTVKEIQDLIKFVSKSGASEVSLETGDIKLTIKTEGKKVQALSNRFLWLLLK